MRSVIAGSGSDIPKNRVTNAMLARIMDTTDEWIRERSGVEARHYVDPGTGTSDLGTAAARRALEMAGTRPEEVDLVVDPAGPAPNVNAFDEVPDSAWFQNRLGVRRPSESELLAGACSPTDLLDGETAAPGSWVIDQGKPNGASPGFRIKVAD